ncbi:WD40-repeat-containing domain protein [Melanogaster broomeanus]|nr:WD40-repeat-containing domain protein [Melanogaster broomeanus]
MLRLYDAARNAYWRVRGLPLPPLVLHGHTNWINAVAFLSDGTQVISGSDDRNVRAWRVEDGREVETVRNAGSIGGRVWAVATSGDGRWIATGGYEKIPITLWNGTTHEKVVELEGHSSWVRSLDFSPDSARVVSGSDDKTVIVWSTTTAKPLADLTGHTHWVYSVRVSPNGKQIASCDDRDIRIWQSDGEEKCYGIGLSRISASSTEQVIPPIEVRACSLAWTPDGQRLIAGCSGGSIKIIDSSAGLLLADWDGHNSIVRSIAVSWNGKFIVSGSWDNTVRIWDTTTQGKKVAGKDDTKGVTALKRRPSESSSLRDFLDCLAVVPSEDTPDAVYGGFFTEDLPVAPAVPRLDIQLPQKKSISRFGSLFTRKKKDGKDKTRTQPDSQLAVQGAVTERPVDPQPDLNPQEFNAMGEGKQKQSDRIPAPADDTLRASTSPPTTSANHPKPRFHDQVARIRQGIMRRRDGSTSQPPIRVKRTYVAYGHMDHRVATAPSPPRKRWKGFFKKKQVQAGSSTANTTGTSQQQGHRPRSPSSSSDSHVERIDDEEASFCSVVVNLLCFCHPDGQYKDSVDNNSSIRSSPSGQISPPAAPPNHPASNKVAMIASSSTGSPIPLSVPASPQVSDSLSPEAAPTTSCIASSSNTAMTSPLCPTLENVLPTSMQSLPDGADPPLREVMSPDEIAVLQEYRRRKGKSTVLSADPAFDHQPSVYCGLPTSSPAPFQCSVMPEAPLGPSPSSSSFLHPPTHVNSPSSTSPVGSHSSLSGRTPSLSTSTLPISSGRLSQQLPAFTQAFDVTTPIDGTPEPDHAQPTMAQDDDEILGDCFIHMYKLDFNRR